MLKTNKPFESMFFTALKYSMHSEERMKSRRISREEINICISYGHLIHRTGACFYFLRKKDLIREKLPEKLHGLCVLLKGITVITVYKNQQAFRTNKKLSDQDLKKFAGKAF